MDVLFVIPCSFHLDSYTNCWMTSGPLLSTCTLTERPSNHRLYKLSKTLWLLGCGPSLSDSILFHPLPYLVGKIHPEQGSESCPIPIPKAESIRNPAPYFTGNENLQTRKLHPAQKQMDKSDDPCSWRHHLEAHLKGTPRFTGKTLEHPLEK